METRQRSEKYKAIAEALIQKEPALEYIKDSGVRIAYLESNYKKNKEGKTGLGECERVLAKNKWAIDYDFTITLFNPNIGGLTEEQLGMVMFHELLHVGIEAGDESDRYYIRPHDLEDFKMIIDRFGTDYCRVTS